MIEFNQNDHLRKLIQLSYSGDSIEFVNHFNSLTESQSPFYSQFKLWFYCINQRKFIIENKIGKDIYMVHYNGFVFGANFSKMIVIRKREQKIIDFRDQDLSYSSCEEQR